jgi:hypothetical protein
MLTRDPKDEYIAGTKLTTSKKERERAALVH